MQFWFVITYAYFTVGSFKHILISLIIPNSVRILNNTSLLTELQASHIYKQLTYSPIILPFIFP